MKLIAAVVALIVGMGIVYPQAHIRHVHIEQTSCDVTKRPYRMAGTIKIGDRDFNFISGGKGWSIPYGDWEITPDDVGRWGRRHGALGLNHDDGIPDPILHRLRQGIEIHYWRGDTAGCVGIPSGYAVLKKLVLDMIKKDGRAYLHVQPCKVEITSTL